MRKFSFYYLLFIILILVNGCAIKLANLDEIQVKSINSNWQVKIQNLDYIKIKFYNVELPNIEISIVNLAIEEKSLNLFLPIPIPYKTINGDKKNCNNNFPIIFQTTNKEGVDFLKTNILTFYTTKTFIIKDNKKYKIDGGKDILNISEILLKKIEQNNNSYMDGSYARLFISQIGCQSLEGTTLVIGGIYLNGEELPPIEIKLSYDKK